MKVRPQRINWVYHLFRKVNLRRLHTRHLLFPPLFSLLPQLFALRGLGLESRLFGRWRGIAEGTDFVGFDRRIDPAFLTDFGTFHFAFLISSERWTGVFQLETPFFSE